MKRILLVCSVFFLRSSVMADVSDSGNLVIGNQGVIQGTMTVQGNAFSVGGSTFSVAGGSITLGGRLNLGADGIKWPNGTVTTSTSDFGGGGNSNLSSTQSWSGAQTFLSTSIFPGPLSMGPDTGITVKSGYIAVQALSVDGASQSSGCVVMLGLGSSGAGGYLTATSTTTDSVNGVRGVLAEDCPANTVCRVKVAGLVRHKCNNGLTVGFTMGTSSTRCNASHRGQIDFAGSGRYLETGSTGWCTTMLGWGGP